MQETLIELMDHWGYAGVAALIFIENIFPPIPSEVVLLFGGFMTTYTAMGPWQVIAFATLGSYAGACVLYGAGHLLDKRRLQTIVNGKFGRFTHLKAEDIEKADAWFSRCECKAVFLCRCVPIVRSLISVPAGMAHMPFGAFTLYTLAGSTIWNTVLVWLGRFSSSAWESNLQYLSWYSKGALALLVAVAAIVLRRLGKRKP